MMPAMLDDPMSPTIYRTSGAPPYPDPNDPQPSLPIDIIPRRVTLRDRVTIATILPFSSRHQVPPSLLACLCDQLNKEIEGGDTYPMIEPMEYEKFASYWFQNFGAVMLLGNVDQVEDVGQDWSTLCLGSFYIKPNYPGRSSHVCNAGFLVTDAARNRGVGRLMGETYIDWAPKLGYTYSVFNLVYETNVASCRIWDALGFKRIGRVKDCGNLKSYPDQLVDAIIYGRDLGPEGEDLVSEQRFDKIKFYLKFGTYPNGADRAEKSRLRSAATHYKLLDGDKLMLKDKEVISDPKRQYEIARKVHVAQHGGINKTTATIAELYHWIRIKETVSLVIKNCDVCREMGKVPVVRADGVTSRRILGNEHGQGSVSAAGRLISLQPLLNSDSHTQNEQYIDSFSSPSLSKLGSQSTSSSHPMDKSAQQQLLREHDVHIQHQRYRQVQSPQQQSHIPPPTAQMQHTHHSHHSHQSASTSADDYMILDPQIMEDVRNHLGSYVEHDPLQHENEQSAYHTAFQGMLSPLPLADPSPQIRAREHHSRLGHTSMRHNNMNMVNDDEGDGGGLGESDSGSDGGGHHNHHHHHHSHHNDLDMLIEDDDVDVDDVNIAAQEDMDGNEHHEQNEDLNEMRSGMIGRSGDGEGEDAKQRLQTQMAARAAEAAMMRGRATEGGKDDGGGDVGLYGGGLNAETNRYRHNR